MGALIQMTPALWIEEHAEKAIADAYRDELPILIGRVLRDIDAFVRAVPMTLAVGVSGDFIGPFERATVVELAKRLKATSNDTRCWIIHSWKYYGLIEPPRDRIDERYEHPHAGILIRDSAIHLLPPRPDEQGRRLLPLLPERIDDHGRLIDPLPAKQQVLYDTLSSINVGEQLYETPEMAAAHRDSALQRSEDSIRGWYPGITTPANANAAIVVRKVTLDRLKTITEELRTFLGNGEPNVSGLMPRQGTSHGRAPGHRRDEDGRLEAGEPKRPIPLAQAASQLGTRSDKLADKLRRRNLPMFGPVRARVAELDHIIAAVGPRHRRKLTEWADRAFPP
jgi:hypothetical protein